VTARVGIDASALEPIEHAVLVDLLDPLLSRVGVKAKDVLAVNITGKRITLRLTVRNERGHAMPKSWAHVNVDVLEGVSDDA
jgi:hypothetical protein